MSSSACTWGVPSHSGATTPAAAMSTSRLFAVAPSRWSPRWRSAKLCATSPCPAPREGWSSLSTRKAVAREQTPAAGYELDLNSGRAMPFRLSVAPDDAARHWYVIDRAIIREHGLTVHGPPAREVFAPFERETLLTMLSESVGWHKASADARLDDTVLNGCRAWRYAEEDVLVLEGRGGFLGATTGERSGARSRRRSPPGLGHDRLDARTRGSLHTPGAAASRGRGRKDGPCTVLTALPKRFYGPGASCGVRNRYVAQRCRAGSVR